MAMAHVEERDVRDVRPLTRCPVCLVAAQGFRDRRFALREGCAPEHFREPWGRHTRHVRAGPPSEHDDALKHPSRDWGRRFAELCGFAVSLEARRQPPAHSRGECTI